MKTVEEVAAAIVEQIKAATIGSQRANDEVYAGMTVTIADAIEADRAQQEKPRHIIFTAPFEEVFSMSDAERRLEELLDEGHPTPTVVNASTVGGEVIGLTARTIIDTAKAGEIR